VWQRASLPWRVGGGGAQAPAGVSDGVACWTIWLFRLPCGSAGPQFFFRSISVIHLNRPGQGSPPGSRFNAPTGVDLPTYTSPPHSRILSQQNFFETQQIGILTQDNLSRHTHPPSNHNTCNLILSFPTNVDLPRYICRTIHTALFSVTQPASIPSHTPPPLPKTSSKCSNIGIITQDHPSRYSHPSSTHNMYSLILCDPISVNLLTYTLSLLSHFSPLLEEIHTTLLSASQLAPISSHTPPTHNTNSLILVSPPASTFSHMPPTHNTYHLSLCDPTCVNLLKYTLPFLSHLSALLEIHTTLLSASQPASISSHTPPTHNTYSLILGSKPASTSSHTPPTHNAYRLMLCDPTSVVLLTSSSQPHHTKSLSPTHLRNATNWDHETGMWACGYVGVRVNVRVGARVRVCVCACACV